MAAALARHDVLLSSAIEDAGGTVLKHTGDGVLAVFRSAAAAVAAAVSAQQHLGVEPWRGEPVAVRMGVHSGEAVEVGGDYFGPTLNRAARVMAAGWGGQILCTSGDGGARPGPGRRGDRLPQPGGAPPAGRVPTGRVCGR